MMPCKAQLALIALVVVLGSMQMLASCGQKGDLYLPGDAPEERR
ncbi:LPS translocon maturation chaperone LptM [Thioalkalivibrio sp.]